jgi:single-stranded-DNA-specific exonuclease
MTTSAHRWHLMHPPLARTVLQSAPPLTPLQVQLLTHRGVTDPTRMRQWLAADVGLLSAPETLPDIDRAVARLRLALTTGEGIGVVGDCDADGLTATAIIMETLATLGAGPVPFFVAPRIDDGRGLTMAAVAAMVAAQVRVCVTVDNGSSSVDEVAALHAQGIDTIITDHHHLPEIAPAAYAIVNPQRPDARTPASELSGAGVALQVARALLGAQDLSLPPLAGLVELAGLGTLADAVALDAENHTLVKLALRQMTRQPRPGISALLRLLNLNLDRLGPRDLSFAIAPRLNAAGRVGDPAVALRLLLATDEATAADYAHQLDALNVARQQQTESMLDEAYTQARAQVAQGEPIIFIQHADWPMGLVGLVAGRMADEFERLAVVVALHGAACRASLRGPRWFHIAEALATCDPPLAQFGGHAQAGGFSAPITQLPAIHQQLSAAYARALQEGTHAEILPLQVDAEMPLNRITPDYARQVQALAPFGAQFSEPLFVTTKVRITKTWSVADRHLKFNAEQQNERRSFFWRNGLAEAAQLATAGSVDIVWRMPTNLYASSAPEPTVVAVMPTDDPA